MINIAHFDTIKTYVLKSFYCGRNNLETNSCPYRKIDQIRITQDPAHGKWIGLQSNVESCSTGYANIRRSFIKRKPSSVLRKQLESQRDSAKGLEPEESNPDGMSWTPK